MKRLLLLTILPAFCAAAAAATPEKRPTKMWNLTGPLGETPKRVTDAFPLSDQQNKGGWVKFEPMTDEFDGNELEWDKDEIKYFVQRRRGPHRRKHALASAAIPDVRQRDDARLVRNAQGRGLAFDLQHRIRAGVEERQVA